MSKELNADNGNPKSNDRDRIALPCSKKTITALCDRIKAQDKANTLLQEALEEIVTKIYAGTIQSVIGDIATKALKGNSNEK